ncbi:unnamed protein product [Sphagnum jensenii]|uniref:CST complex subunit CTC1 n=1 Tax=Sphagnum jensenii TaxID=128206 RepID=A0ABP0WW88_9BRYO
MHENCLSLRDLLSITLPFSSSSFFLHNTHSLPLASSSSDAAEQTCVGDSGSHPKRTIEGAAAAAFPVVEFCNSVRKKRWRLGSKLLQVSREPWSIVGRLQLWNTITSTCSVADLQRDRRTIDCLDLTDGEISICCSVASLHPQFVGQLVQITCWTFVLRTACSAVCRHAVVKCSSVVEAAAAEGSKQLLSSSGNTNASQKYLGKGKIVHGPSCSGEEYKSSLSAGGCLEIHNPKLLAGSSALSLQVEIWGLLHCISPPFVLPSKASPLGASVAKSAKSLAWNGTQKSIFKHGSAGQTMLGFIVEVRMFPHIPSCEHTALLPTVGKECVHVYFSGSAASWRPVLSVVIGQCVTITGLQRKLILVGPEKNEHFLFVATKSSLVSQLSPSGCVPMGCGGKEPYFRAREMDPTASGVTRATIHKELASDSKEGTFVATAFWQSSSSHIFNAGS